MRNKKAFLRIQKGFVWLGWRDSNPRMSGSKPDALPLGDTPSVFFVVARGRFELPTPAL